MRCRIHARIRSHTMKQHHGIARIRCLAILMPLLAVWAASQLTNADDRSVVIPRRGVTSVHRSHCADRIESPSLFANHRAKSWCDGCFPSVAWATDDYCSKPMPCIACPKWKVADGDYCPKCPPEPPFWLPTRLCDDYLRKPCPECPRIPCHGKAPTGAMHRSTVVSE